MHSIQRGIQKLRIANTQTFYFLLFTTTNGKSVSNFFVAKYNIFDFKLVFISQNKKKSLSESWKCRQRYFHFHFRFDFREQRLHKSRSQKWNSSIIFIPSLFRYLRFSLSFDNPSIVSSLFFSKYLFSFSFLSFLLSFYKYFSLFVYLYFCLISQTFLIYIQFLFSFKYTDFFSLFLVC